MKQSLKKELFEVEGKRFCINGVWKKTNQKQKEEKKKRENK